LSKENTMHTSTRPPRAAVAVAGLVAASTLMAACGGGAGAAAVDLGSGPAKAGTVKADALKGTTMTFVSYGGIYQDGQKAAAVDPFAKEAGAKVVQDGPTDNAKIKAQVTSKNVTWDVIDTTNVVAAQQCGKLFLKLDTKIVDTSKIPAGAVTDECSVPAMGYGLIVVYNKKKYGSNPPKTWADFYDTTKFPGKRSIEGTTGDIDAGVLEGALLADGVAPGDMYPLDVNRALKKMSTIRKDTVFWSTGAQSQQLVESGQVDMSLLWSGRAYAAVKNGAPFTPMWDKWMPEADVLAVPVGAKNPKASFALINYYLGAKQQAKLTELTSYSPINTDAKPNQDALAKSFLTTTPERNKDRFNIDLGWWAKNHDPVVSAYTSWLAG
jgi:putative spermidine/putrescine transport system substrate-binding protein